MVFYLLGLHVRILVDWFYNILIRNYVKLWCEQHLASHIQEPERNRRLKKKKSDDVNRI